MSQIGVARRNSGEDLSVYAASRTNQLRKSSSAASHLLKHCQSTAYRTSQNRIIELPQRKSLI
jgi:hypothetical protein